MTLPIKHEPYSDKYFLRAKEILKGESCHFLVTVQVFVRNGNARIYGLKEAQEIIQKYGEHVSLRIWSLKDGDHFDPSEPVMVIRGSIQRLIDLETMYLGVISARTTLENDKQDINLKQIEENMGKIVDLVGDKPVSYFGARHWSWDRDADISRACLNAGAANCSTDIGAATVNEKGIGTIPHSLEAIYHKKFGLDSAVVESTLAFDAAMPKDVPRIALIDYANHEIQDSIKTAEVLEDYGNKKLDGIRIDTCGENIIQSGMHMDDSSFWFGKGVCISGVYNIRKALDYSGFDYVKIILSSGFGNPDKVKAFVDAEKILKTKLFDGLGVGGVFHSRMATADIVKIGDVPISKAGRKCGNFERLKRI